jgi:hypothetical protein
MSAMWGRSAFCPQCPPGKPIPRSPFPQSMRFGARLSAAIRLARLAAFFRALYRPREVRSHLAPSLPFVRHRSREGGRCFPIGTETERRAAVLTSPLASLAENFDGARLSSLPHEQN